MTNPNPVSRRSLLRLAGYSAGSLLVGGAGLTLLESVVGQATEPLNQRVEEWLFRPQTLVPEFSPDEIEPNALIVNSFRGTPVLDPATFQLTIDGEVERPVTLDLRAIQTMPMTSMIIRHVCVEGWAAIVQWGGVSLRSLLALVQPKPEARYVYFYSADGYYDSWDMASVVHPQTILAYEKNGTPLPIENGAPLRLASPIKLGYKQSKWVTRISLTSTLMAQRGYWEDLGYEWFAGL